MKIIYTIIFVMALAVIGNAQTLTNLFPAINFPAGNGSWKNMAGVPGGIDQYSTNYTMFCNVRVSIPDPVTWSSSVWYYQGTPVTDPSGGIYKLTNPTPGYYTTAPHLDTNNWLFISTHLIAHGDGITDDTLALQTAVNQAGNNTYVYIPTGKYLVTGAIYRTGAYNYDFVSHPYSIIVRGDGPTNTIILNNGNGGEIFIFQSNSGVTDFATIQSGNTRGSTSMVLSNGIPGFTTGAWIMIERDDTAANVYYPTNTDPQPYYYSYSQNANQYVLITNYVGSTIKFTPPLNESSPSVKVSISYSTPYRCGIEDLSVVRLQNIGDNNIRFIGAFECWIKNVESRQAHKYHISIEQSAACEVRQCFVHDPFPYRDGNNAEGGSDYGICLGYHTSSTLVEDNITLHCRHGLILETAAGQNNVFSYNLEKDNINGGFFTTDYQMATHYHGGEPRFNLFEGNVLPLIRADAVEGATKYDTYFRNLVTRDGLVTVLYAKQALDIQRGNIYDTFVANVYLPGTDFLYRLGSWEDDRISDSDTGQDENFTSYTSPSAKELLTNYTAQVKSLNTFYANLDLTVPRYDYNTNGHIYFTNNIVFTGIPQSLLYTVKPSWYGSNVWPPFGGDISGYTNLIPAQTRFISMGLTTPVDGYTLTTVATNGTISTIGNNSYYNGAWIPITATPNSNYIFSFYSTTTPIYTSTNNSFAYYIQPSNNLILTAYFNTNGYIPPFTPNVQNVVSRFIIRIAP